MSGPGGGDGSPIPVEAETETETAALDDIPMAVPVPNPRRVPPPCWSHDETVALIDAYRGKWYALRRGNLKANDWQDVADAVGLKCPGVSPPKTSVQCRHKMEKLRKRYRAEIHRSKSTPVSSSWVHFNRVHSMENEDPGNDEEDSGHKKVKLFNRNGAALGPPVAAAGGFRIRIPTGVSIAQPAPVAPPRKFYNKINSGNPGLVACGGSNMKADIGGGASVSSREDVPKKRERDPMEEMLAAVKLLGDGFVRVEQMKMEMVREMETVRMETEMKRTQMILDSQQRVVESFAKAFSEKRRKRQQQMQAQPQTQDLPKKVPCPPDSWSIVNDFAKAFSEKRRKQQQQIQQQQPQDLPKKASSPPDS